MKFINLEFNRFILIGGINTVLTYFIYVFFLFFVAYSAAYTLSYFSGIFISYYLNSRFVFKEKLSLKKAFQYPVVYFVQYLLGLLLLHFLVRFLNISELIAPLFIVIITIPVTYLLSRFIIKKNT
jgi:putative flippase GtrA